MVIARRYHLPCSPDAIDESIWPKGSTFTRPGDNEGSFAAALSGLSESIEASAQHVWENNERGTYGRSDSVPVSPFLEAHDSEPPKVPVVQVKVPGCGAKNLAEGGPDQRCVTV